jgi:V/A-type H+-transporting ATPase subunit E
MGIERLTSSLLLEANKEAEDIVSAAESHVQKMLEEERSRNEELRKEMAEEARNTIENLRNERVAWAKLEAKRIVAEAKEDAINNVLHEFFEELKKARKTKAYKTYISNRIKDAVDEFGSGSLSVHVRKGEKSLVPKKKGIKIVEDLDSLGGAIVESKDGKVRMNLTLETIYEAKKDALRKKVSDKLFGG